MTVLFDEENGTAMPAPQGDVAPAPSEPQAPEAPAAPESGDQPAAQ